MVALARRFLFSHKSRHVILLRVLRQISPILSFRVVLHLRQFLLSKSNITLSSRNRKTIRGRVYSLIMDIFLSKVRQAGSSSTRIVLCTNLVKQVTQQAMNYAIR